MEAESKNYWIIELIDGNASKWLDILNYVIPIATHMEFNILYSDENLKDFLKNYNSSIIDIVNKKDKIYSSRKVLQMRITDQVVALLMNKDYADYKNWFLEDPSFYIDNKEVIASITHEDQIYLNPKYIDLSHFSNFTLEHKLFEKDKTSLWEKITTYLGL